MGYPVIPDINRVVQTARLVWEPDLNYYGELAVCNLRVAVNGRRKNKQTGGVENKPNFFFVTVFGRLAELCERYLAVGSEIAYDGRLDWSEWEAEDGSRREGVKIIPEMVRFVGPKRREVPDELYEGVEHDADVESDLSDEDLATIARGLAQALQREAA